MKIINTEKDEKFVNRLEGKKGIFTVKAQKKIQREGKKGIFKILELEGTVKYKGDNGDEIERENIKITSTTPFMEETAEGIKSDKGGPLFVTTARNGGEFFHKDGTVVKIAQALGIFDTDEFPGQKLVVENTGYWEIDLRTMLDGNHTKDVLEALESTSKLFDNKETTDNTVTSEDVE